MALASADGAAARGGKVAFAGGSPAEQHQVTAALRVSSFDWNVLPAVVDVHIVRGADSYALPGNVYLDANLLDADSLSWGVVQHEFAHEFDFYFLRAADHSSLLLALGGVTWFASAPFGAAPDGQVAHGELAAERFASTFAWAFWPSAENVMKPSSKQDESAAMAPAQFRALIASIVARGPASS